MGEGNNAGTSEIEVLENKLEDQLREVSDSINDVAVFSGGVWFRSHMECVDFA